MNSQVENATIMMTKNRQSSDKTMGAEQSDVSAVPNVAATGKITDSPGRRTFFRNKYTRKRAIHLKDATRRPKLTYRIRPSLADCILGKVIQIKKDEPSNDATGSWERIRIAMDFEISDLFDDLSDSEEDMDAIPLPQTELVRSDSQPSLPQRRPSGYDDTTSLAMKTIKADARPKAPGRRASLYNRAA